jgi:hypothetical protein
MSSDFGHWTGIFPPEARDLREQRSGLSGFGGRPALHPAWREPDDAEHGIDAALLSATTSLARRSTVLSR